MFGLKERPYPGHDLRALGVILIKKVFLRFGILAYISLLLILAIIKIW